MSEERQILTLIGITLLIGIIGVAIVNLAPTSIGKEDVVIEEYAANFYPDGILEEEYTYLIESKEFRFLFRVWEAPLSITGSNSPYIEPLEIFPAPDSIGYFKDYRGEIHIVDPQDGEDLGKYSSLALNNEAGSFKPEMYDPGTYTIGFRFDLHPPLEYDEDSGHLNLKLANKHIRYNNVKLTFEDASYIEKIYAHPPMLNVEREDEKIIVTGSSGKDELIEVEMLIDKNSLPELDGFPEFVDGVRAKTINANRITSIKYYTAFSLRYITQILSLITPILLYVTYAMKERFLKWSRACEQRSLKPTLGNLERSTESQGAFQAT